MPSANPALNSQITSRHPHPRDGGCAPGPCQYDRSRVRLGPHWPEALTRTFPEAFLSGRTRSLPARLAWMVLTLLLTCLALGGLISAVKMPDLVSAVVDLAISALLAWGAVGCWRRMSATSRSGSATS